jgi:hypothetical protein
MTVIAVYLCPVYSIVPYSNILGISPGGGGSCLLNKQSRLCKYGLIAEPTQTYQPCLQDLWPPENTRLLIRVQLIRTAEHFEPLQYDLANFESIFDDMQCKFCENC